MMDTRSGKSNLTIKDFKETDEGKFVYGFGDHQIEFFEQYGGWAKMIIRVFYLENSKRYLKDEKIIVRRFSNDKWKIKESNRQMWYWINKFNKRYCNE